MTVRKITAIGNSLGVTLPTELLRAYGFERGSLVEIWPTEQGLLLRPAKVVSALEPEGIKLAREIIQRYRPALDAMAREEKKVRWSLTVEPLPPVSVEEAEALHAEVMRLYPEEPSGVLERGLLESALYRPVFAALFANADI